MALAVEGIVLLVHLGLLQVIKPPKFILWQSFKMYCTVVWHKSFLGKCYVHEYICTLYSRHLREHLQLKYVPNNLFTSILISTIDDEASVRAFVEVIFFFLALH